MDEKNDVYEIIADEVTLEVKDAASGQVFRRVLPLDFYENANFLKISGESLDGSYSELVFLSAKGAENYKDIVGKGEDHDSCGTHS